MIIGLLVNKIAKAKGNLIFAINTLKIFVQKRYKDFYFWQ